MEDDIRKTAIRRYILGGESPKTIYTGLNRSKKWFFKWLKRYQTGGMDWYEDKGYSRLSTKKTQSFESVEVARTRGKCHFPKPGTYEAAEKRRTSCLENYSSTF